MRMPKTVKVGGHEIVVRSVPYKKIKLMGSYTFSSKLIEIADDYAPSIQASTLLHEVLHACYGEAGLLKQFTKAEESIICGLEPVLFQVIRDNPKLIKFLQEA